VSDQPCRSSEDYPLRVDSLPVPGTSGSIGMTICPGKKGASLYGPAWCRDLAIDLEAIRAWHPDVVVTLMEAWEFAHLGVPGLGPAVEAAGFRWLHLPIPDTQAPDATFHSLWREHGPEVRRILREGGRVLLHCRGGLGRTGTLAAQLLVEFGEEPAAAIRAVRRARRVAIETRWQEEYVLGLRPPEAAIDR
jgi:ADP-ribosyl-[dinitrogen reductase] hydrolase